MDNQADDKANKPWVIRDVSERTRRLVKTYAAAQGINVAEALEQLVDKALEITSTTSESATAAETIAMMQDVLEEALKRHAAAGHDISEIRFRVEIPEPDEK